MPSSLQVTWEAEYHDGRTVRERDGFLYENIDRDQLRAFRVVSPGEILFEVRVKDGQNGHGLAYRRRTVLSRGTRTVWFCVGMIPSGPVLAYQPETNQLLKGDRFESGSGPLGKMVPMPYERWTNTAHSTDAMVRRSSIHLPSGAVLSV